MGLILGSLFLALVLSSSAFVLLDDDSAAGIEWPSEYYFKGQTVQMSTGLVQPFRIWYSSIRNISRMELFGGEINSYFVAGTDEEEGGVYKLLTITTKNMTNVQECRFTSGSDDFKDFMPSTDDLNNTRSYIINGKVIQEWRKESIEGDSREEYTLLLYRTEYGVDVPVSYEEKKYNLDIGSLVKHTITEYFDFKPAVNDEDVEITNKKDCEDFGAYKLTDNLKFLHPALSFDVDLAFDWFKTRHNKKYSDEEHEIRKAIFHKNWRLIEDHNRKNLSYKMAINKFADLTDEELLLLTGTRPSDPGSKGTHIFHSLDEVEKLVKDLPEEFDLRLKGALRPIKQQGSCLSCWAFTAAATVEGALSYRLGGRNVDLSEQSLVDCSWGYGNNGCKGGMLNPVFSYILEQGIPADVDYGQYKQEDGVCHVQNLTSTFKIRGFGKVNHNSVNSLKLALNEYGPIAVSVMATHQMYYYSSGVFFDTECEGGKVNHGLVVVGYGSRHGDPYWIVRNSWGEQWGEDGYILMAAAENNCFILGDPYYVLV